MAGIFLISTAATAIPPRPAPAPYVSWQPPGPWYVPPPHSGHGTGPFGVPRHPGAVPWSRQYPGEPAAVPQPGPQGPAVADSPRGGAPDESPPTDRGTDHKAAFLQRLRPLVERENARLLTLRGEVAQEVGRLDAGAALNETQAGKLRALARKYRVDGDPVTGKQARQQLLDRIDIIPMSLALAQAANESAWGKSRFAREGNNLFGIWTYDTSKGIVPRRRAAGKKHLVRRFDTQADSVRYYMFTLNSHPAYQPMRDIRARRRRDGLTLAGLALVEGLGAYSAKGEEYVRLIRELIERLDLAAYDGTAPDRA